MNTSKLLLSIGRIGSGTVLNSPYVNYNVVSASLSILTLEADFLWMKAQRCNAYKLSMLPKKRAQSIILTERE